MLRTIFLFVFENTGMDFALRVLFFWNLRFSTVSILAIKDIFLVAGSELKNWQAWSVLCEPIKK